MYVPLSQFPPDTKTDSVHIKLIQKSSSPVMVCRRPLRLTRTVHKSKTTLRAPRVKLADAKIDVSSSGGAQVSDEDEPADIREQMKALKLSDHRDCYN